MTTTNNNPTASEVIMYLAHLEMKKNGWDFEHALKIVRNNLNKMGLLKQPHYLIMKPNQLRVGNWVIGIEENDYYQVTSATITMLERGEGSHIRPVPINQTWLRQLRFENCINGWWSKDEMLNFKLNDDSNEIYLRGSDTNLANYPIDYVHELQNLYYAIFGKEIY